MTGSSRIPHRRDIQGLRAVAVTLVIVAHAFPDVLPGGTIGVDVFFVISGFLITSLLLKERNAEGRIGIAGFYARRARRILPAAAVVLVATLALSYWTQAFAQVRVHVQDAIWSLAFAANIRFAAVDTDYWADHAASPFRHYWSLAVEEQFYLVWPLLLVVLLRRGSPRRHLNVVLLLGAASLLFAIWFTHTSPLDAYFNSFARAYQLLIGAIVAFAATRLGALSGRTRMVMGSAGLIGIILSAFLIPANAPLPGWIGLAPTLSCGAIIAAGIGGGYGFAHHLLSLRPAVWIGDISYSLYLWHWPALVLGVELLPGSWSAAARSVVMIAASVFLAALSYTLLERPIQTSSWLKLRIRRSLSIWPVTAALVLGCALWVDAGAKSNIAQLSSGTIPETTSETITVTARSDLAQVGQALARAVADGKDDQPLPGGLDLKAQERNIWYKQYRCAANFPDTRVRICPMGDVQSRNSVVLIGDSHAGMWLYTLDALGKQQDFKVIPLLKHACSAFDYPQLVGGKPFPACVKFRDWAISQVTDLQPDTVVLASRGYLELDAPEGTSTEETWSEGVAKSVQAFGAATDRVVVLSDLPGRPQDVTDCVTSRGADLATCETAVDGSKESASNPHTEQAATDAGGSYVDVVPLVCSDSRCPALVGTNFVYFDDNHLSVSWGELLPSAFAELVGPLVQ